MKDKIKKFFIFSISIYLLIGFSYAMAKKPSVNNLSESKNTLKRDDRRFKIIPKVNPNNSKMTDFYILDIFTGKEVFDTTLPIANINSCHYHPVEFHRQNVYFTREINYPGENWNVELWKYGANKKEIKIYSDKGIDFRVSFDERFVAIVTGGTDPKLIFIDLLNNNVIKVFTVNDFKFNIRIDIFAKNINFYEWSENGNSLWVRTSFDTWTIGFCRISVPDWKLDKYDVFDLKYLQDFDLNTDNGKIVLSDYKTEPLLPEKYQEKKETTLYIYDLYTKEKQIITTAMDKEFRPKWTDNNTVEYDNPRGSGRIKFRLK